MSSNHRRGGLRGSVLALGVAMAVSTAVAAPLVLDAPRAGSSAREATIQGAVGEDVRPAAQPPAAAPLFTARFKVGGRARVAKLNADLPLAEGSFVAALSEGGGGKVNVTGTLDLPPAPGRFVVFRFMPVTAVSRMTQEGPATGVADTTNGGAFNPMTDLTLRVNLALGGVGRTGCPWRSARTAGPSRRW